jgi:3-mercaptopyruvate sulfurtransferase SseA
MRSYFAGFAALLLVPLALAACQNADDKKTASVPNNPTITTATSPAAPQNPAEPADGVKRMTIDDARAAVEKGTAIIVDVRRADEYKANHIKGSISIPYEQIADRVKELPKDKTAVLYCS